MKDNWGEISIDQNEYAYLCDFVICGLLGCLLIARQSPRKFSSNIFTKENLYFGLGNIIFAIVILLVNQGIFSYKNELVYVLNNFVYCLFFVAVTEEWVYRGYFLRLLSEMTNNKTFLVLFSAGIFSLMHLSNYIPTTEVLTVWGVLYRLLIPFLMGIVFALVYLETQNLFICIVMHGIYDLIERITCGWFMYVSYIFYWAIMLGYLYYLNRKRRIP